MKYRRSLFHILYFSCSNPLYFHSSLSSLSLLSAGTYPLFCILSRKPNTMTGVEGNAGHAHWAASANGDERRSTTHIMFPPSTLSRSLRAAALFFFAGVLGVLLNMVWDSSVLDTVPGRPFKNGP